MRRRNGSRLVAVLVAFGSVQASLAVAEPGPDSLSTDGIAVALAPLRSAAPAVERVAVPEGRFEVGAPVEAKRIDEMLSERSASSETWRYDDGSIVVSTYAVPKFFQPKGETGFVEIDSNLVIDGDRLRSSANRWEVSFGASGAKEPMQQFVLDSGIIGFDPVGADFGVTPVADGTTVVYRGLWRATDAVYQVSAVGVDERLVLHGPDAPTTFAFEVTGATPRLIDGGGVELLLRDEVVSVIPPLTVETAKDWLRPSVAGARFVVEPSESGEGGRVTIAIDSKWLAGLSADEFPVVIDPTVYTNNSLGTQMLSYDVNNTTFAGLRFGYNASNGATWRARAWVPIPDPAQLAPGGSQPWRLTQARLFLEGGGGHLTGLSVVGHGSVQPLSFTVIGQGTPLPTSTFDAPHADITNWAASRVGTGSWYGLVGTENPPTNTFGTLSNVRADYRFFQSPDPVVITSPTGTISTTTPLLTAQVTNDPAAYYSFKVSTDATGTGALLESGWIQSSSWQVPAGALADGMTYHVRVQTATGTPWWPAGPQYIPPAAAQPRSFTIKKRLGAGGPSPTDTVGAVPGSTVTPSEGAPSPGVSPASVTVNMATGNLALVMNTRMLPAIGGAAGVTLNYDSLGSTGLDGRGRGLYATYRSGSGPGAVKIGERVDPAINFAWPGSPMGGYATPGPMTAEWTGTMRVTAADGQWRFGGVIGSGTMAITINGVAYATLSASPSTPVFGPNVSLAPGVAHEIKITYVSSSTRAVQFWAQDTGKAVGTVGHQFLVPSGWLTPRATGLPMGWRLSANPYSGSWTRLEDRGSQVVAYSSAGATATFTRRPDGTYAAPPGVTDLLTPVTATWAGQSGFAAGEFVLSNNEGTEFVFGVDGWVRLVRTLTDDRRPAALGYTYTAVPGTVGAPVLTAITDPVAQRSVTLCYSSTCDIPGYATNAPPGMLARISYWDGTTSWLIYDTNGRLIRLINPGDIRADLSYDTDGRLIAVRDALAYDTITAGYRPDCTSPTSTQCSTTITYHPPGTAAAGKVATVTQPAPTNGALRPARTYSYPTNDTAQVQVAGFTPQSGRASWVRWDSQGRIVEQKDSKDRTTHTKWDPIIERVLASVDPAGLQTTNVYDPITGAVTDVYGPAPTACFAASAPFTPTGPCAVPVPRTQHRYDEGVNGLAATFWNNPYFAGAPVKHQTGPGGTGPSGPGCTANTLCTQWDQLPFSQLSGSELPAEHQPDHKFTWSMRLTGVIDVPNSFVINTATTQQVSIYLNGAHYTTVNPHTANIEYSGLYGEWWVGPWGAPVMPAGRYEIRIDFLGASNGTLNGFWFPSPSPGTFMPNSMLSPAYGNRTTTIDPEGRTVTSSYTDAAAGIDPMFGLVTSVTQDPAGLALTSTSSYEPVTSGRWLRKTASTLPGGSTTTFTHYCSTPTGNDCDPGYTGAIATACGVAQDAPQHGQLAQQSDPAASGAPPRVQQFLYDTTGRQVGRRVGTSGAWECTTYDDKGRVTMRTWPASGPKPARAVTYTYSVGGNPLVSSVTGTVGAVSSGTITSTVDLLGRVTSYTDAGGRTTLTSYDQPGRVLTTNTTSTATVVTNTYDPDSGQLATVTVRINHIDRATATLNYDTVGRVTTIGYGSQVRATYTYDTYGRTTGLQFTNPATSPPNRITGHTVTRSIAGRIVDELIDTGAAALVDPNPTGENFVYDGAGRLTTAHLNGGRADYSYATSTVCNTITGANPNAGRNTNRTTITWNGTPTSTATSCYNHADQLIATTTNGTLTTAFAYDTRGNQTLDGPDTYTWDSSDRLAAVTTPAGTITYTRDPLDRLTARNDNGITTRYGYNGHSDTPTATYNATGGLIQQLMYLPGGVLVTIDHLTSARTWSYPNLHGHHTATSNHTGTPQTRTTYDPWGNPQNPAPDNTTGTADLNAYGANGKLTETTTTKPITHMGARPYTPINARFLTIDPIHGGCANNYTYGFGDPINGQDLTGKWWIFDDIAEAADDAWDATGGKVVSWIDRNACTIATWAGHVATAAAVVGVFASLVALTVATGGAATVAAGAAYLGTAASAVQFSAGAIAGDRGHMVRGGIGTFVGGMNSANWAAATGSGLPRRVAAGFGLYSEVSNAVTSTVVDQSVPSGC
jgi:RHS repeat-associated protein